MILFKDYATQKKSVTFTGLVITFALACTAVTINLVLLAQQKSTSTALIWASLGLMVPFVGLYWNKRIRASATGIELGGSNGNSTD